MDIAHREAAGRRRRGEGERESRRTAVCGEKEGAAEEGREGTGGGVARGGRFHAVDCWTCSSTPGGGRFWPFAGIRSQHRLATSPRLPDYARARARDGIHIYSAIS